MKPKIVQLSPHLNYGDAIGNDILNIHSALVEMGYESYIVAEHIDNRLKDKALSLYDFSIEDYVDSVLIYHMAIGWPPADKLKALPVKKKIMKYHNITPAQYFADHNDNLYAILIAGRAQLRELKNVFDLALADSEYNRRELLECGYENTGVLPCLINLDEYNMEPDSQIMAKYKDGRTNIIFVGRVARNKKHEDIIKSFYYYKHLFNPGARLFLVGSHFEVEYYKQLMRYVDVLQLKDVYFTGHVSFQKLLAYYKIADLFLCMSEHEGFCVPLVESMYFDIPILAYNSSALAYTLENSGILFEEKNHHKVAELMNKVISDKELREQIIFTQRERLKAFDSQRVKKDLKTYLDQVLENTAPSLSGPVQPSNEPVNDAALIVDRTDGNNELSLIRQWLDYSIHWWRSWNRQ